MKKYGRRSRRNAKNGQISAETGYVKMFFNCPRVLDQETMMCNLFEFKRFQFSYSELVESSYRLHMYIDKVTPTPSVESARLGSTGSNWKHYVLLICFFSQAQTQGTQYILTRMQLVHQMKTANY